MATDQTVTEDREETQAERSARLDLEKKALRSGRSDDALPERLLALLGCNLYADIDGNQAISHERALLKYASATAKAVAIALQGDHYVCANEAFETEFTTEEAAVVLCGLSSLLAEGPSLVEDIRHAGQVGASEVRS